MNPITAKIAQQSKIILVLAKITRIILYIVLATTVLMMISTWIPGGVPIIQIGTTRILATIPLYSLLGVDADAVTEQQIVSLRAQLAGQIAAFILSLIMLSRIILLFTRIRDSKEPFTADVIRHMKVLAILLGLVIGIENFILGVVVAFMGFAFAMIFQYGAELQNQIGETL